MSAAPTCPRSALVDGLEWNVRLSRGDTPVLLDKFAATFDTYWADGQFEPYDPDRDGDRLDDALGAARGDHAPSTILSGLDVRPYPFQQVMLDQLDTERQVHDRWRNLVVSATGTGKTVVAALDYRRLCEQRGRDLSLLFVAHRREILDQAPGYLPRRDGRRHLRGDRGWAAGGRASGATCSPPSSPCTPNGLAAVAPAQFDVVIVDEFHHAEAATYRRLLEHVEPVVLLGLTATPERGRRRGRHRMVRRPRCHRAAAVARARAGPALPVPLLRHRR